MSENKSYLSRLWVSTYFWPLLGLLALSALLPWQFWAQGATPSDPRLVPRAVTPRGDLAAD